MSSKRKRQGSPDEEPPPVLRPHKDPAAAATSLGPIASAATSTTPDVTPSPLTLVAGWTSPSQHISSVATSTTPDVTPLPLVVVADGTSPSTPTAFAATSTTTSDVTLLPLTVVADVTSLSSHIASADTTSTTFDVTLPPLTVLAGGTSPSPIATSLLPSPTSQENSSSSPTLPTNAPLEKFPTAGEIDCSSLPGRPGNGTLGTRCVVLANHFKVQMPNDMQVYQYTVAFTPMVVAKELRYKLISELAKCQTAALQGICFAFDGVATVYTKRKLSFLSQTFNLSWKGAQFAICISAVSRINHNLRQAKDVLNVIFNTSPSISKIRFQGLWYSPAQNIGFGFSYWSSSFRTTRFVNNDGISLNIDVGPSVTCFEPILVTEFVKKFCNITDTTDELSAKDRTKIEKALRGVYVTSNVDNGHRQFKINGISNLPVKSLRMRGEIKNVVEYYRDVCNTKLQETHWPAIETGLKPILLPMEVCKIVPGQRFTGKLNLDRVTRMLDESSPARRRAKIEKVVRDSSYNTDEVVGDFQITVDETLTSVEARVLDPPQLMLGRKSRVTPQMGQWSIDNQVLYEPLPVAQWLCVNFSTLSSEIVKRFCKELSNRCKRFGMGFNATPAVIENCTIASSITEIYRKYKFSRLVVVILPDDSPKSFYMDVKRICEIELGISSQCCRPQLLANLHSKVWETLALKINAKVGGRNWVLSDALRRKIPHLTDANMPTMVFGADVTHPEKNETSPSISAVVASIDWPEVTRYSVEVSAQLGGQEIIENLKKNVCSLVRKFEDTTGKYPRRIIFYRDGVSDGMFSEVLLREVIAIREACVSVDQHNNAAPNITFVVVKKRHHTRFFPTDETFTDKSGNIQAGTVVDTHVCSPTDFDFFLSSHIGFRGTSRPGHYYVLRDENGFSADQLQQLTNNLCYSYAKCSSAVSLVTPVYYAHLAAYRARSYGVKKDNPSELPAIHKNLKDTMFFC